jgi:3-deoxy-manno-octulosonate cytidylyltransferase (CMP-KDO synthetase)
LNTVVVIPARLESSRLPRKLLLPIGGKPIIRHVFDQVSKACNINDIIIATDSPDIYAVCKGFTDKIVLTGREHQSGTDRIAEVARSLNCNYIINVQGDEPFINPDLIDQLSRQISGSDDVMASAMCRIHWFDELNDPNIPKVIVDKDNYAIYFSRLPIPFIRDKANNKIDAGPVPEDLIYFKHTGIYAYKKDFLLRFSKMEQTYLEKQEKLEQLRAVENGFKIKMLLTEHTSISIDTKEDYEKAVLFYGKHGI